MSFKTKRIAIVPGSARICSTHDQGEAEFVVRVRRVGKADPTTEHSMRMESLDWCAFKEDITALEVDGMVAFCDLVNERGFFEAAPGRWIQFNPTDYATLRVVGRTVQDWARALSQEKTV